VAVFLTFFCIQGRMVYLATHGFEGPDSVDYYREGLEYNREIVRQNRQRAMAWQVSDDLPSQMRAGERLVIHVRCLDRDGQPLNGQMRVDVGHPATRIGDAKLSGEIVDGHGKLAWVSQPGTWDFTLHLDCNGRHWQSKSRVQVKPR